MNHFQFECKIQLSEDGKTMYFHNSKMDTNPQYVYEKTPEDVIREEKEAKEALLKGEEYKEPELPNEFSYF